MIELANAALLAVVSGSLLVGALVHGREQPAFAALLAAMGLYLARRSLYWMDQALWEGQSISSSIDHPWLVFINTLLLAGIIALAAWERRRL